MIITPSKENILKAAMAIQSGQLVSFPTETVYGLGADARNSLAVKEIFKLKGRPSNNPLIIHIDAPERIWDVTQKDIDSKIILRIKALLFLWPAPLSLVVPKNDLIAPEVTAGSLCVAVRMPNHAIAIELLKACDCPVAAPSANRSNYLSPTTAKHVEDEFGSKLEMILDGGPCQVGIESTVINLIGEKPKILRLGAISKEQLQEHLDEEIEVFSGKSESPTSPGMLGVHYSPTTPLILKGDLPVSKYPAKVGLVKLVEVTSENDFNYAQTVKLCESGEIEEVARRLYSALRELDQKALDLIVVEPCENTGMGAAVMDRLIRARGIR